MKATKSWTRTAAGGTGIAADAAPTLLTADNVMHLAPPANPDAAGPAPGGIALLFKGPGGAPSLDMKVWLWEETTEQWFQVAAPTVAPNVVSRVSLPVALDTLVARPWQPMHVAMTCDAAGAAPNGSYVFAAWGDVGSA